MRINLKSAAFAGYGERSLRSEIRKNNPHSPKSKDVRVGTIKSAAVILMSERFTEEEIIACTHGKYLQFRIIVLRMPPNLLFLCKVLLRVNKNPHSPNHKMCE